MSLRSGQLTGDWWNKNWLLSIITRPQTRRARKLKLWPYVNTYWRKEKRRKGIQETLILLTCADNSVVLNITFGSDLEHLPVLRLYAGSIHESNPEHLLILQAPCGDDPPVQSRKLPCFKAQWGDNPRVWSGTPPCFKAPRGDNPQVQSRTPPCF